MQATATRTATRTLPRQSKSAALWRLVQAGQMRTSLHNVMRFVNSVSVYACTYTCHASTRMWHRAPRYPSPTAASGASVCSVFCQCIIIDLPSLFVPSCLAHCSDQPQQCRTLSAWLPGPSVVFCAAIWNDSAIAWTMPRGSFRRLCLRWTHCRVRSTSYGRPGRHGGEAPEGEVGLEQSLPIRLLFDCIAWASG